MGAFEGEGRRGRGSFLCLMGVRGREGWCARSALQVLCAQIGDYPQWVTPGCFPTDL